MAKAPRHATCVRRSWRSSDGAGTTEHSRLASTKPNRPHLSVSTCRPAKLVLLPGPPRSPMRTDVSRSLRNSPQFAGVSAGSNADVRSLPPAEVAIASILAAGLWALQTRSWRPAGVAHEDHQDQIDKPSIAYWRDHSA